MSCAGLAHRAARSLIVEAKARPDAAPENIGGCSPSATIVSAGAILVPGGVDAVFRDRDRGRLRDDRRQRDVDAAVLRMRQKGAAVATVSVLRDVLERAEQLAKVGKQEGSLWHAYRRKWATERKHLPDVDVMAAGGWKDLSSLKTAYQHADAATLYRVVSEPAELREAKA